MVGLRPVEGRAVGDEDLLFAQQVEGELLVVGDAELLDIELREHVQRTVGAVGRDAVDRVEPFVGDLHLRAEAARRQDEIIDRLLPAQGRLDRVLGRNVRAHAHIREQLDALEVAVRLVQRSGDRQPAGTVAGDPVGLRQPGEGQAQNIVAGERGHVDQFDAVVGDLLVDLVGEDDEAVAAGDVRDLLQRLLRVHRTGRVVRVDDDDSAGAFGDPGFEVVEVRLPGVLFRAAVVDRGAAGQRHRGGPQRIVRAGHEDFVVRVAQGLQAQGDEFADSVAEVDLVGAEIVDAAGLVVLDDGTAGRQDPPRVRIPLRHGKVRGDVLDDRLGGFESEGGRVADVELEDRVPGGFHRLGLFEDGSSNVIEDIGQLRRLPEHVNRKTFHTTAATSTLGPPPRWF